MVFSINTDKAIPFVGKEKISDCIEKNKALLTSILSEKTQDQDQVLGWFDVEKWTSPELLKKMQAKAEEIRQKADVFILVGVGGSNNGARAVIKAMEALLQDSSVEIIYAGTCLSANEVCRIQKRIAGKSVYMDVIAKNFATLEPGLAFRILRRWMREQYGDAISERIVVTGTVGSQLEQLANQNDYLFLPFPDDIGGRYSVLSPVGLFPIMVAGIDVEALICGSKDMEKLLKKGVDHENPAVLYGVLRYLLERNGFAMEFLSSFEPAFEYFAKWWVQLFAESEGKDNHGLYPVACSFSEDLHSVGQYIQSGKRTMSEVFLKVERSNQHYTVLPDDMIMDGFDYLNGKDVNAINEIAFEATLLAHAEGGVPCTVITIPEITPYYFGQLFYFFEMTCYISCALNGVDPFDQPGVESYKTKMMAKLKTPLATGKS